MAVRVARAEAEEARAALLAAVPEGFEERDAGEAVELVAYVERGTEGRVVARFGAATVDPVELDWEDGWRAFHRPARIGELWVGPPWGQSDPDAVAVVIDPGRAFGTGAHPTTRLCLELLQELPRGSLVDLGCGSGVVAIAAAKLGFAPVLALDVDLAAVEVTRDNAAANRVAVDARHADVVADPIPAVDVVVANVSLPVVAAVAPRVRAGRLVTSGYRSDDHVQLPRWRVVAQRESDGWAAHAFAPVPR